MARANALGVLGSLSALMISNFGFLIATGAL